MYTATPAVLESATGFHVHRGVLASFHRRHPGIEITLTEDNSAALIDNVRSGDADIALAAVAGEVPDGLRLRPPGSIPAK